MHVLLREFAAFVGLGEGTIELVAVAEGLWVDVDVVVLVNDELADDVGVNVGELVLDIVGDDELEIVDVGDEVDVEVDVFDAVLEWDGIDVLDDVGVMDDVGVIVFEEVDDLDLVDVVVGLAVRVLLGVLWEDKLIEDVFDDDPLAVPDDDILAVSEDDCDGDGEEVGENVVLDVWLELGVDETEKPENLETEGLGVVIEQIPQVPLSGAWDSKKQSPTSFWPSIHQVQFCCAKQLSHWS